MPLYEYQCAGGHREVAFRRFVERTDPLDCPACGGAMGPIISAPHVQNSTATENSLKSWGDDWRYDPIPKRDWVAQERANRQESED